MAHNGSLVVRESETAGSIREPRPPVSFAGSRRDVPEPAPALGTHTNEVLTELGYDAASIAALRSGGALGPA